MLGRIFAPALLALLSAGCSSLSSLRYAPSSAEVAFSDQDGSAPWARTYAHLVALREGEGGAVAVLRLLVENQGSETLQVVEGQFGLLDGSLARFGEPRTAVVEGDGWSVPPAASALIELRFPFPPGDEDEANLQSLTFAWGLRRGVEVVPASAVFDRVRRSPVAGSYPSYWYDPCYYDPWFGFSAGIHYHGYR